VDRFKRMAPGGPPRSSGSAGGGFALSGETRRMLITALIIFGLLGVLFASANFWVNWWWFGSMEARDILTTGYISRAISFTIAGLLGALFFSFNVQLAIRNGRSMMLQRPAGIFGSRLGQLLLLLLTALVAISAGSWGSARWQTWRLFTAGRDFGVTDPIYGRDASWYVFRLPAIEAVQQGLLALLIWTVLVVIAIYAVSLGLERLDFGNMPRRVTTHVLAIAGLALLLIAAGYVLSMFGILYSRRGFTFGGGFTDVNIVRPLNLVLAVISVIAAVLLLIHGWRGRGRILAGIAIAWVVAVLIGLFLPATIQQVVVEPNELTREAPYITNNIRMTRSAFDLDNVDLQNLSGQGVPPADQLVASSPVFDNIRLWDYRIAQQTFQQLRSFVPYYVFPDVDVDRYQIDGKTRQVLVAARELDTTGLPANAQTWVNRHISYTHGYGMVVSPISESTSQGLPRFLVGSIPPEGTGPLEITRPEIYFGEIGNNWVAVNTARLETSGISGETVGEPYSGEARGSVQVSNYLKRVILALHLGDRRIMFSNELTADSKLLLRRPIMERARAVAPFLVFDPDPYLVIVEGRLIWVVDAYTGTNRFPGSTPTNLGVNYLRNTAKVTIDAYNGTVTLYRTAVPDPVADAWSEIYGNPFLPIEEAPPTVREHFRYPEAMFDIQTEMYASYHVTDPVAFYNGEDRWAIATEESQGTTSRRAGGVEPIEAYYMTLPLPGDPEPGFKLVRPFTPINRPNMTAWMAGKTDDSGLPSLLVYRFPRQSNTFGPQQVEARINQDPDISARISLLDQAGSRVIRGNLLVVPVGEAVLYIQPIYLQATATQGAPTELQFVIVASQDDVQMRPTLGEALAAVAEGDTPAATAGVNVEGTTPGSDASAGAAIAGTPGEIAAEALDAYQRGQDALRDGNWTAYGEAQARLERLLEDLAGSGPVIVETEAFATPSP
jgi:uncharacterized protein